MAEEVPIGERHEAPGGGLEIITAEKLAQHGGLYGRFLLAGQEGFQGRENEVRNVLSPDYDLAGNLQRHYQHEDRGEGVVLKERDYNRAFESYSLQERTRRWAGRNFDDAYAEWRSQFTSYITSQDSAGMTKALKAITYLDNIEAKDFTEGDAIRLYNDFCLNNRSEIHKFVSTVTSNLRTDSEDGQIDASTLQEVLPHIEGIATGLFGKKSASYVTRLLELECELSNNSENHDPVMNVIFHEDILSRPTDKEREVLAFLSGTTIPQVRTRVDLRGASVGDEEDDDLPPPAPVQGAGSGEPEQPATDANPEQPVNSGDEPKAEGTESNRETSIDFTNMSTLEIEDFVEALSEAERDRLGLLMSARFIERKKGMSEEELDELDENEDKKEEIGVQLFREVMEEEKHKVDQPVNSGREYKDELVSDQDLEGKTAEELEEIWEGIADDLPKAEVTQLMLQAVGTCISWGLREGNEYMKMKITELRKLFKEREEQASNPAGGGGTEGQGGTPNVNIEESRVEGKVGVRRVTVNGVDLGVDLTPYPDAKRYSCNMFEVSEEDVLNLPEGTNVSFNIGLNEYGLDYGTHAVIITGAKDKDTKLNVGKLKPLKSLQSHHLKILTSNSIEWQKMTSLTEGHEGEVGVLTLRDFLTWNREENSNGNVSIEWISMEELEQRMKDGDERIRNTDSEREGRQRQAERLNFIDLTDAEGELVDEIKKELRLNDNESHVDIGLGPEELKEQIISMAKGYKVQLGGIVVSEDGKSITINGISISKRVMGVTGNVSMDLIVSNSDTGISAEAVNLETKGVARFGGDIKGDLAKIDSTIKKKLKEQLELNPNLWDIEKVSISEGKLIVKFKNVQPSKTGTET